MTARRATFRSEEGDFLSPGSPSAGGRGAGPSPPCAVPPRVTGLEAARSLAVVGVVFNHAVDGLVAAGVLDPASPVARFNAVLYVFRMPALAFLLGLFIPGGVARRGTGPYLRRRITTVLYLYVLWFYLQSAIEIAANGVKNQARDPDELLTPWVTFGQLWFLPFLAVATGIVAICRPWRSTGLAVCSLVAAVVLSLLAWGWNPRLAGAEGLSLVVFTMAGAAIGLPRMGRWFDRNAALWVVVALVGAAGLVLLFSAGAVPATVGLTPPPLGRIVVSVGAAACGIGMLLAVSALLGRVGGSVSWIFTIVGSRTMAIFLAHVVVVAGSRVALLQVGVTEPYVILPVAVVLGVAFPAILCRWSEARTPWRWLFDAPRLDRGRASGAESRKDQPVVRVDDLDRRGLGGELR